MRCAITAIGSLPHTELEPALALSLGCDLPFVVELPRLDPDEFLIPAALRGFAAGTPELVPERRLLERLERGRAVKVQLVGPVTLKAFGKTIDPAAIDDWLVRRARATIEVFHGHDVLFVVDEPALVQHRPEGLQRLVREIRSAGARVGVHCCGNTDWAELLSLPIDLLSFDARASLDAVVDTGRRWPEFVGRGGALMLGIIPTQPGARYDVDELCDGVEATLRATTRGFEALLSRSLLTPACGLALHTVADAERIFTELRQAQRRLQAVCT